MLPAAVRRQEINVPVPVHRPAFSLCAHMHTGRTRRKELGHENNEQSSAYTPPNGRSASRPTQEQLFLATSQHEESAVPLQMAPPPP